MKKKKYPPIEPAFTKDKKIVYLDAHVFESILEEAKELREKIKQLDKAKKKQSKS